MHFDSWAIWFYIVCLATFLAASLADLNGSSIGVFPEVLHHGAPASLLAGSPKPIRMDEWGYHTPFILYQSLRPDRFAVASSPVGDHSVSLLASVPVAHISTLFRPQFWSFFFLPVDYAFAVYWQFKALFLLTGIFTFFLLLTGSTFSSIVGALWYFFSGFTQWCYSWPFPIPEMVGLICFVMVFACYLSVGRSGPALALISLAAAACAINFGMCVYVPHLVPLIWLAVLFFFAWCVAKAPLIFRREQAGLRLLCIALAIALVTFVGIIVYFDARSAIIGIANTVYPGKRVFSPPTNWLPFFMTHFLNWTETEVHFPHQLQNICEGSGFLWLAPVTFFCIARLRLSKFQKIALIALWSWSAMLLAWLLGAMPVKMGKFLGLTLTGGTRANAALGLANIAIVMLCVACLVRMPALDKPRTAPWGLVGRVLGVLSVIFTLLVLTNYSMGHFYSHREVWFASAITTILVILILEGRRILFACALLIPLVVAFGLVNPIERGVDVFTSSDLYKLVHSNKQLLESEWIVFSEDMHSPKFLAAIGCRVYNGFRYLPDIDRFALFQSKGYDLKVLNTDAHVRAHPLNPDAPSSLEQLGLEEERWNVSPSDPLLKELGIKYAAFADQPPATIASRLIPLGNGPIDHFWLYRIP
jgi:hypothetical protein